MNKIKLKIFISLFFLSPGIVSNAQSRNLHSLEKEHLHPILKTHEFHGFLIFS